MYKQTNTSFENFRTHTQILLSPLNHYVGTYQAIKSGIETALSEGGYKVHYSNNLIYFEISPFTSVPLIRITPLQYNDTKLYIDKDCIQYIHRF